MGFKVIYQLEKAKCKHVLPTASSYEMGTVIKCEECGDCFVNCSNLFFKQKWYEGKRAN